MRHYKGSDLGVRDRRWNVFPESPFLLGCAPMDGRTLVLGHRGASAVAPENTIAAFAKARELGADGAELDVRRSADGVLMVHHDPQIAGFGALGERTFDEIRAARPSIPTFDEALRALRGLVVNAEVKCLPWEIDADRDGSVMRAAIDALGAHDGSAIVSSFAMDAVDLARAYAPHVVTGWLTHGMEVVAAAKITADHGHQWLNPDSVSALAAGAEGVDAAHRAGLRVSVWTVDDPDDARALAGAGVDAIISNAPDAIIAALSPS
jgi:glycerophosphoryl diester phosphodiesterase